ncbi:MAG: Tfp pilus assembly protein PilZ [bacterium]|jgi:Tfp pilus assembly protein PilZ
MYLQCKWCQEPLKTKNIFSQEKKAHFICNECLIPILEENEEFTLKQQEQEQTLLFSNVLISTVKLQRQVFSGFLLSATKKGIKIEIETKLRLGDQLFLSFFGKQGNLKMKGEVIYVHLLGTLDSSQYRAGILLNDK